MILDRHQHLLAQEMLPPRERRLSLKSFSPNDTRSTTSGLSRGRSGTATGVVDVAACLDELKKQKFDGHISIEHENDWKNSVPQVKANIDFVKAQAK